MVSVSVGAGLFHARDGWSFEFAVEKRWNLMNFKLFSRRRGNIRSYLFSNLKLFKPLIHLIRRIPVVDCYSRCTINYSFFFVRYLKIPVPPRRTFCLKKFWGRRTTDNLTSDYSLAHVPRLNITAFSVLLYKTPCFPALSLQPGFWE